MKLIVWDYNINPYDLYKVVIGEKERIGQFDRERVFLRMIERLSWYDLINILGHVYQYPSIREYTAVIMDGMWSMRG